jgi:microcystin-dependent protein
MNSLRRSLALAVLLTLAPAFLRAQTVVAGAPSTIDYQGKALDATGSPLANTTPANYEMQFRIYDAQESGSIIWSERQVVTVSKGLFSVRLGEGTANGTEGSVAQTNLPEAFNGRERFLGVTIVITGQTPVEILPRLAFLATPFAYVANKAVSAERLILNPSTSAAASSINLAQVSYATQSFSTNTTLTDQNHTAIVDAGAAPVTVTLPGVTSRREYYIAKKDSSTNIVTVTPPAGGTINGNSAALKLKVLGESVVIQNTGGNDWWIVSDTRDKTPVGTIISSGKSNNGAPPGYVYCDGGLFSRSAAQYSDLFAAIGTAWGTNSASDFRVPDMRGMFLRGVDGNRGADDDRNSRSTSNSGGNSGDAVGSLQADSIRSHGHSGSVSGTTGSSGEHSHGVGADSSGGWNAGRAQSSDRGRNTTFNTDNAGSHTHSFSGSFTTNGFGGSETRPENVAVYYFIKY